MSLSQGVSSDNCFECSCSMQFVDFGLFTKHVAYCPTMNVNGMKNDGLTNLSLAEEKCEWQMTVPPTDNEFKTINEQLTVTRLVVTKQAGIICQQCFSIIEPKNAQSHVASHGRSLDDELMELLDQLSIPSLSDLRRQYNSITKVQEIVHGLPVLLNGYICKLCPDVNTYCSSLSRSVQKHVTEKHGSGRTKEESIGVSCLQTLINSSKRPRWFPVLYKPIHGNASEDETAIKVDTLCKGMLESCCSQSVSEQNPVLDDARTRNLFFQRYRWDNVVADIEDTGYLVREPKSTEEPSLAKVFCLVKQYFVENEKGLLSLDINLRRYFAQPASEEVFQSGFRSLEQDSSLISYSIQATKCVIFHCRLEEEAFSPYVQEVLTASEAGDTVAIQTAIHALVSNVFLVAFPGYVSLDDNNVNKFLACQAYHANDGSFDAIGLLAPRIARLLHGVRLAALFEFLRLVKENPKAVERAEQFVSAGETAYEKVFRFVRPDTRSICEYLVTLQGYVRRVAATQAQEPRLIVVPGTNGEAVRFRPLRLTEKIVGPHMNGYQCFTLTNLKSLYSSLWKEAVELLDSLALGIDLTSLLPAGLLQECTDDLNRTSIGYSFLQNSIELKKCQSVLLQRALKEETLVKPSNVNGLQLASDLASKDTPEEFQARLRQLPWDQEAARQYLTTAAKFVERMCLLIHIGSGQPARGEEMRKWKIRNVQLSTRDMFLSEGRILLMPSYNKTRNRSSMDRPTPRYLPVSLSLLVLRYYALVRPFESILLYVTTGDVNKVNTSEYFMFVQHGATYATNNVSEKFQAHVFRLFGVSMGLSTYRHIAMYLKERFLQGTAYDDENTAFDLQAGHTRKTATIVYGRTDEMPGVGSSNLLTQSLVVSKLWQDLLEIDVSLELNAPSSNSEEDSQSNCPCSQVSYKEEKHPITSSALRYEDRQCVTTSKPMSYRLSFRTTPISAPTSVVLQCLQGLRQVLQQPNAAFRSPEQAHICSLAYMRKSNLLCIQPTGSGKSLSFLIPAFLEAKENANMVTVLVEPLLSLRRDMIRRAQKIGLQYCHTLEGMNHYQEVNSLPNIMALTIDQAVSASAMNLFASLNAKKQLARIVIDEAHTIVSDQSWRYIMSRVKNLLQIACPFLLLTATLPLPMEEELCRKLCITPFVFRSLTARTNIEYRIKPLRPKSGFMDILERYCTEAEAQSPGVWRGIVFFQSKKTLESCVGAVLKNKAFTYRLGKYHADLEEEEKNTSMTSFMSENDHIDIMFATKAFGMGIDYPHIRFTIHYGAPATLFDYSQESGRAGRDGEKAISLVLYYPFNGFQGELRMEESMEAVLQDDTMCIREALSQELDGFGQCCYCFPECSPCERCANELASSSFQDPVGDFLDDAQLDDLLTSTTLLDPSEPVVGAKRPFSALQRTTYRNRSESPLLLSSPSNRLATNRDAPNTLLRTPIAESDFTEGRKRIHTQIHDDTRMLTQVKSFFEVYSEQCTVCLLNRPFASTYHTLWKCPYVIGKCLCCLSDNHNARNCDARCKYEGVCNRCGLTAPFHESVNFGATCSNWATGRLLEFCRVAWRIPEAKNIIIDKVLRGRTEERDFLNYLSQKKSLPGSVTIAFHVIDSYLHLTV